MPVRGRNGGNKGQGSNWITRKRREAIYARDEWRCVWCAIEVYSPTGIYKAITDQIATLDHVIPREAGGDNGTHNLVTCCMRCNRLRGTKTAPEFADELFRRGLAISPSAVLWCALQAVYQLLPAPRAPSRRDTRRSTSR